MADQTDRNQPEATTGSELGYLAQQRAGLCALLALSSSVVLPAEAEIEARFQRDRASAEDMLQRSTAQIETRMAGQIGAAEQNLSGQISQIRTQYQTGATELAQKTRTVLERIAANMRETETEIDRQVQEQLLVADTVAQATCERLRQERQIAEQHWAEAHKRLEEIQNRAFWVLERNHLDVPAIAESPNLTDSPSADAVAAYQQHTQIAVAQLEALEYIGTARMFMGGRLYLLMTLLAVVVVGGFGAMSYFGVPGAPLFLASGPISLSITVTLILLIGWVVRYLEQRRLLRLYGPLAQAIPMARQALEGWIAQDRERHRRKEAKAEAARQNNQEKQAIQRRFDALLAESRRREYAARTAAEENQRQQQVELEQRRDGALRQVQSQAQHQLQELRLQKERDTAAAQAKYQQSMEAARTQYETERAKLSADWQAQRQHLERFLTAGERIPLPAPTDWANWEPPLPAAPDDFTALVPFGYWQIDLAKTAPCLPELTTLLSRYSSSQTTPALLSVPEQCSLLLQTERAGRPQAIDALRVIMLRLLTSLRPGRVRFTIIDPVGLGMSFAGFMHLVDYEESLVGGRIWTESDQIEDRLVELTNHMENVIQKYLRNEFASIDVYNRQAGQLAEPYRFLIVADFPTNFSDEAVRRLSSIISSGARCGVFTLIMNDKRLNLPPELPLEDLVGQSLCLKHDGEQFHAVDDLYRHFSLTLDAPPAEEVLTRIMHVVGRGAKNAFRVEVPFDSIVPSDAQQWSREATTELDIPVGHAGAIRRQHFSLGRGLAQHALVAGKTGSGKSTLLHVVITNLALWYSPDEVELYLVDFKKGVEFKTYVTHGLPHARAIAIESDREFGVSVLQRLDAEMTRRGELFRAAGVQDLPAYRAVTDSKLPRTLLIVDEFQVFFAEDDKLAQEAGALLDRLVRQGRAFGIHVLLGSQTLAGYAGLARSTMGQMAVRIALQCSEADSQVILDDTNLAARLLSRPGEAIYNDAGGLVAGNSTFQVAWLPDERQAVHLNTVQSLAQSRGWRGEPAIVFEGNTLADIRQNRPLIRLVEDSTWPAARTAPKLWLGEPVAIKDPTSAILRWQSGANLLAVGQREDVSQTLLSIAMLCLGCQHSPASAQFVIMGGAAMESPVPGGLQEVGGILPHPIKWVEWREVPAAMAELSAEVQRRIEQGPGNAPSVYVLINGLQRYRVLRRREDSFSFSSSDEDTSPATDRQFAELLREGPALGMHVLVWADTLATLERTLDRQSLREFDNRILFQMSAADSSNLIDTPEANRLGLHRALFFSEERGLLEKFRPYGALDGNWLMEVRRCLEHKRTS